MARVTEESLKAAENRGQKMLETEPRALSAQYDLPSGRVTIDLTNGATYAFPVHLVEDLQDAKPDDLIRVDVDGAGFNLHWPTLDVDLYVPALVAGVFGTREWMTQMLARIAGQSTSPAKVAAAKANGAKGGRPRKMAGE
jgi:hypothetical protein